MTPIQPRQLVHVGRVLAQGFAIDPQITGEVAARARILGLWQPGASLACWRGTYILRLPSPRSVRVEMAPGVPLVLQHDCLSATPLTEDEAAALSQGLIMVHGTYAYGLRAHDLETQDPATWIDVSGFIEVPVQSLGAPPAPARPPRAPGSPHLRDHVAALPKLRVEAKALQEALHGRAAGAWPNSEKQGFWDRIRGFFAGIQAGSAPDKAGPSAGGAEPASPRPGFADRAGSLWHVLGSAWRSLFGGKPGADEGLTTPGEATGPSALSKWWRNWLTKVALRTRIARLLGRRQAKYLQELLDMFDEGDLDAALRHAIPLGDDNDGSSDGTVSLGVPSPRDALSMSMGPLRSDGGSLFVGDSVMDVLRQRYRRAFERLVQKDRIEEAAFVLADLLQETDEAVSFLESHSRFQLAAELAESRMLAPAKVVRQWVLAGDLERAIDTAKLHDAFAPAIALLENKHAEHAERLRLLWADALAERGHFERAVDAIWKVESARRLAEKWIIMGIRLGGPSAARLLVRAVKLLPERFDEWLGVAEDWWADPAPEEAWTRSALAEAIVASKPSAQVALLAKGTLRAQCNDVQLGHIRTIKGTRQLVKLTDDGVLKADWPGVPKAVPPFLATERRVTLNVPPGDVGALPIFDAVSLARGRFLLALGEAGMRVVSSTGQTLAHFDEPAHDLVISDQGHRALGLARRGRFSRITRVDLVRRRATPWCDYEATVYAKTFDGWSWFVADKGALTALDIGADQPKQLWRNKDCIPKSVSRSLTSLWAHQNPGPDGELWQFDLPGSELRSRTTVGLPVSQGGVFWGAPNSNGQLPFLTHRLRIRDDELAAGHEFAMDLLGRPLNPDADEASLRLLGTLGPGNNYRHTSGLPADAQTLGLAQIGVHSLILSREPESVLRLVNALTGALRLSLSMAGSTQLGTRVQGERVLAFDEQGRLMAIDLHTGSVQRSLRIRA